MTGQRWTGQDATALRTALWLTMEDFAERLGVSVGTVAHWASHPTTTPRAAIQRHLDEVYATASDAERARFGEKATPEGPTAPQFFRIAMAIVTRDSHVLVVQRRDDNSGIYIGFPAGTIKPGEDPATVAVRETLAETAVMCSAKDYLGHRVHPVTGVLAEYFACCYDGGEAANLDPEENEGVMWVPIAHLGTFIPRGSIFPPVLEILEDTWTTARP